ncbi:hypothetical protein RKE29_09220 [Streptomyces sp. B1866]|uniref:hypothetical protein n=1 Tax=Streptomyces sp. B1866 TaxID=3075431 RepID=UPI00288FEE9A|nr:hypothetical protein [Streptomyces sp. B1866]MDT3396820.1 hypothetical protein [Streptomyces sp. B1866]
MSFGAEWTEGRGQEPGRMNLAGVDGGTGGSPGGTGRLRSTHQAWRGAAEGVGEARVNLRKAEGELARRLTHQGGGAGAEGLASVASHRSVHQSWLRRLDLVGRECEELKDKLRKAADAYYKTDGAIKEAFQEQRTTPQESSGRRPHQGPGGETAW